MTIRCDVCGEECNQLFTACIILTSMIGGVAISSWFTDMFGLHLI